jgi:hypothetical protein
MITKVSVNSAGQSVEQFYSYLDISKQCTSQLSCSPEHHFPRHCYLLSLTRYQPSQDDTLGKQRELQEHKKHLEHKDSH